MMATNRKRPLPDDSSENENLDDTAKIAKHEFENDENFFIDSKNDQPLDQSGNFLSLRLRKGILDNDYTSENNLNPQAPVAQQNCG